MDAEAPAAEAAPVPGSDDDIVTGGAGIAAARSQLPQDFPADPAAAPAEPRAGAVGRREKKEEPKADKMDPETADDFLDVLLSAEAPPAPPTEEVVISRPDGSLHVRLTIRGLLDPELETIGDRAWRNSTARERKLGAGDQVRDMTRMKALTVAEAIVVPNLADSTVLTKFGPTPEHVVRKWFLPGEIEGLAEKINDLSGYGEDSVTKMGKS